MNNKKKLKNTCDSCGEKFRVKTKEEKRWKKLCLECWKQNQQIIEEMDIRMDRLAISEV